jgi:hypothetical protein
MPALLAAHRPVEYAVCSAHRALPVPPCRVLLVVKHRSEELEAATGEAGGVEVD